MTIKRKATKKAPIYIQSDIQDVIDQVISRGGKTTADADRGSLAKARKKEEVRFTLRLSKTLVHKIDESRKRRAGIISRNQWILEAVTNAVEQSNNCKE